MVTYDTPHAPPPPCRQNFFLQKDNLLYHLRDLKTPLEQHILSKSIMIQLIVGNQKYMVNYDTLPALPPPPVDKVIFLQKENLLYHLRCPSAPLEQHIFRPVKEEKCYDMAHFGEFLFKTQTIMVKIYWNANRKTKK